MDFRHLFTLKSDTEVIFPASLKDSFLDFVSASGIQFAPQVTEHDEKAEFHKDNVLILPRWEGDPNDRELYDILPFLESKFSQVKTISHSKI